MPDTPQFNTAQYIPPKIAGDTCRACSLPVTGVYYVANGSTLCGSCGEKLRQQIPQDSHAAFVRGILFALGGFVAGLILYAGFTILTGIEIGFVSLAVGWLVGKAMMIGSHGVGGRRYQIAAVLLTYAAVSTAFIPIVIHFSKQTPDLAENAGRLIVLGLASPFLQLQTGASGVIGLIILFVGMRFAWRMTKGVQVAIDGPYGSPAKT